MDIVVVVAVVLVVIWLSFVVNFEVVIALEL